MKRYYLSSTEIAFGLVKFRKTEKKLHVTRGSSNFFLPLNKRIPFNLQKNIFPWLRSPFWIFQTRSVNETWFFQRAGPAKEKRIFQRAGPDWQENSVFQRFKQTNKKKKTTNNIAGQSGWQNKDEVFKLAEKKTNNILVGWLVVGVKADCLTRDLGL